MLNPERVYEYLKRNYPASTLKWVKGCRWAEMDVPLSDIRMARRPGGRNMAKVRAIAEAASSGKEMEPVVLVRTPEGLEIADGYHRTLAYRHLGRKRIRAWVAEGAPEHGPWESEMHRMKKNLAANKQELVARAVTRIYNNGDRSFRGEPALPPARDGKPLEMAEDKRPPEILQLLMPLMSKAAQQLADRRARKGPPDPATGANAAPSAMAATATFESDKAVARALAASAAAFLLGDDRLAAPTT